MSFDKQRFCGKLFQKTSGIEIPRYLKNRFFACGNGNGKTAFLARGNGNGTTAAVPTSGYNCSYHCFYVKITWTYIF